MNETVSKENSTFGKLTKASLARRFLSGLIDVVFLSLTTFILLIGSYFLIFPSLNYFSNIETMSSIYEESHLYIKKDNNSFISLKEAFNPNVNLKEYYDDNIIYFYKNDERAIYENKLEKYQNAKIASGLFIEENGEIIEKSDINSEALQAFYEKHYDEALEIFASNKTLSHLTSTNYWIMMGTLLISLFISSFFFYLIMPLLLKNKGTLAQLMFKIGCCDVLSDGMPTKMKLFIRYISFFLASFVVPLVIYKFLPYLSVLIISLELILICVTKDRIGIHDAVSKTYLIDLRNEVLINKNKNIDDSYSDDRIQKLLGN